MLYDAASESFSLRLQAAEIGETANPFQQAA